MRVFCDLPGVNEEVYVGVVLPSYASFLGVPVVDVVVLLSPGDGGAAGADALDGLKNKESKGGVERKTWGSILPLLSRCGGRGWQW